MVHQIRYPGMSKSGCCGCSRVEDRPMIGKEYRHFKGEDHLYRVKDIARDADDPKKEVVYYEQLFANEYETGTTWVRSLEDFVDYKNLEDGKTVKRFTLVE